MPDIYGERNGGTDEYPFMGKTKMAEKNEALLPPDDIEDDSFDRVATAKERLKEHIDLLTKEGCNGKGIWDSWNSGTLAFLKSMVRVVKKQKRKIDQDELSLSDAIESESGGSSLGSGKVEDSDLKLLTDIYFEVRNSVVTSSLLSSFTNEDSKFLVFKDIILSK